MIKNIVHHFSTNLCPKIEAFSSYFCMALIGSAFVKDARKHMCIILYVPEDLEAICSHYSSHWQSMQSDIKRRKKLGPKVIFLVTSFHEAIYMQAYMLNRVFWHVFFHQKYSRDISIIAQGYVISTHSNFKYNCCSRKLQSFFDKSWLFSFFIPLKA